MNDRIYVDSWEVHKWTYIAKDMHWRHIFDLDWQVFYYNDDELKDFRLKPKKDRHEKCVDEIMKIIETRYDMKNVVPRYEIKDAILKQFPQD